MRNLPGMHAFAYGACHVVTVLSIALRELGQSAEALAIANRCLHRLPQEITCLLEKGFGLFGLRRIAVLITPKPWRKQARKASSLSIRRSGCFFPGIHAHVFALPRLHPNCRTAAKAGLGQCTKSLRDSPLTRASGFSVSTTR